VRHEGFERVGGGGDLLRAQRWRGGDESWGCLPLEVIDSTETNHLGKKCKIKIGEPVKQGWCEVGKDGQGARS